MKKEIIFWTVMLTLTGCQTERKQKETAVSYETISGKQEHTGNFDLPQILENGELIAVTLSGPDTYYEYQGRNMGVQYALAEQFATRIGATLRMEVVKDTAELMRRVLANDADLIAVELPEKMLAENLTGCGSRTDDGKGNRRCWGVRKDAPELAQALNQWYTPDIRKQLAEEEERKFMPQYRIRRRVSAPYLSRAKGIISPYDALFKRHAKGLRWDWKLLAAQCYQESAFDPTAVSWAGAKGLMQIMPATGRALGLNESELYNPEKNVGAAARYLKQLERHFGGIASREERIWFALAAYNGGAGHIDDARMLARTDGKDDGKWDVVKQYVLLLSNPKYYNHPKVEYGYMRGSETYDYVERIRSRWYEYRR